MGNIRGIRCLDVAVANIEETSKFFGGIWSLSEVMQTPGARCFRGTAHYHHVLALHEAGKRALIRVVFDAADRAAVERLYASVRSADVGAYEAPHELRARPGGGYGFKDPEGRNLAVVCDVADYPRETPAVDRPIKISHVNLNSAAADHVHRFYIGTLGLRLSDETELLYFLRCNSDHHSILLAKPAAATLNHVAFEMMDIDSVMRGGGRLKDHGYPIEWGPGRHGAGNNVFCYFAGPEELPIEYTAGVEQVDESDESYVAHGPAYWKFPSGRTDRWGITEPRSLRLKRVQSLYRFANDHTLGA
jgi:catechol-2,3-dioxygenase